MSNHEKMQIAFEAAAKKKGYLFDKNFLGMYKEKGLQEAWELFSLVDFKVMLRADNGST